MISAQDLIEKITSAATCDDCIVVVRDRLKQTFAGLEVLSPLTV